MKGDSAGYLAVPTSGQGMGVLVLHPWWGLSDAVRATCERLAAQGYLSYAPDLYHGRSAATIEAAQAMVDQLNPEAATVDIAQAVDRLWERRPAHAPGLGVIGLSLGAFYALRLSAADPERIKAVVLFYGTGDGEFGRAKASYLGHYAETDPYEPVESVNWLEGALQSANRPVTFHRYADVGHWFFERDRPEAYNASAAELAWERTLAFFRQTLT